MEAPRPRSLLLATAAAALFSATAVAQDAALPPTLPVELQVETLRVGADGTQTLAEDRARVFVGKGALLSREVTLDAGGSAARRVVEKLGIRAELRVVGLNPSGLTLALKSRVRVLALSGGGTLPRDEITRDLAIEVSPGASQLVTIYESPTTGAKATLNVRWSIPDLSNERQENPVPVQLSSLLSEVAEGGDAVLADHRLLALLGQNASATFERVVALPDAGEVKRARHEHLELTLTPVFLSGRTLSVAVEVGGQVSTLLAEGGVPHRLAHQGNYLFSVGIPVTVELEVVSDSKDKEGWERVRYRLEIVASY